MGISPLTAALSSFSSFFPRFAVRGIALALLVVLTRHLAGNRERRLAVIALTLMFTSVLLSAAWAGLTTWFLARQNYALINDPLALFITNIVAYLLPLLESAGLLMLTWAMAKALAGYKARP